MVLIMTPEQIEADIPDDIDRKADETLECANPFVWLVNQLPASFLLSPDRFKTTPWPMKQQSTCIGKVIDQKKQKMLYTKQKRQHHKLHNSSFFLIPSVHKLTYV